MNNQALKTLIIITALIIVGLFFFAGDDKQIQPGSVPTNGINSISPKAQEDEWESAVGAAISKLSQTRRIPKEAVVLESVSALQWPDSCLGLPREEEACAQVVIDGYEIILKGLKQIYVYRTDARGTIVREETARNLK